MTLLIVSGPEKAGKTRLARQLSGAGIDVIEDPDSPDTGALHLYSVEVDQFTLCEVLSRLHYRPHLGRQPNSVEVELVNHRVV